VFEHFTRSLSGYIEFGFFFAGMAPFLSAAMASSAPREFIEKAGTKLTETPELRTFKAPFNSLGEFNRLVRSITAMQTSAREVPRMLTVGLLSTLEFYIGQIMRSMTYNNMEEVKLSMIERAIDTQLRDRIDNQIKWIEEKSSIQESINKSFPKWSELIELVERRNLFVHANSKINAQYLHIAKRDKFKYVEKLKIGQELDANPRYFRTQ
jgi:hypothetical protein